MQRRHFFSLLLLAPLLPSLRATGLSDADPTPTVPTHPDEPWHTDPDTLARWRRAPRLPLLSSHDPVLHRLLTAVRDNETIHFNYHGGRTPAAPRTVTPGHLYTVEGFPGVYLSGYCHTRQAERTFLVARLSLAPIRIYQTA